MHYLSLTSVRLQVYSIGGTQIDVATGFFLENSKSELFLVTNWHVLTGRSPQQPTKCKTGAVPASLRFTMYPPQGGNISLSQATIVEVVLNDAEGNSPTWLEHPDFGHRVDLAALPIPSHLELSEKYVVHCLNRYAALERLYHPTVMDSVFVVGYPWGLAGGGTFPVYKRGSIASEPIIAHNGLPRMLIDCRTSSSMSGSPVIASHSGIWTPPGSEGLTDKSVIGTVENFLGVYGGRLTGEDLRKPGQQDVTEIGVVWRADALSKIVEQGILGITLDEISKI